jgi:hypothetical protein
MKKYKQQTREEMLKMSKAWELESNRIYQAADFSRNIGRLNQCDMLRRYANSYRVQSRRLNKTAYESDIVNSGDIK